MKNSKNFPSLQTSPLFWLSFLGIVTTLVFASGFWSSDYTIQDTPTELSSIHQEKLAKSQIPFIKNIGQSDDTVKFYAKTLDGTVYVTDDALTYSIPVSDGTSYSFSEKLSTTKILDVHGITQSQSVVNYFIGDESNWTSNVPTFDAVGLGEAWPSIDVKLQAYGKNVEKLFFVNPGASIHDIKLELLGVDSLSVLDDKLILHTSSGNISMTEPIAYQEINGKRNYVDVEYTIHDTVYGFTVGEYNPEYTLVIDPLLASTFLGSTSSDTGRAIAVDSSGNVFVTGFTSGSGFPTTSGVYDTGHNTANDVFVSKFSSDLTTLSASTFVGGSSDDKGLGIVLDTSGNVYISGTTSSSNFPTTASTYDDSYAGSSDLFVSKLSSDLTLLPHSTFLGGSLTESFGGIALDTSSNVFVAGSSGTGFPTISGSYSTSSAGGTEAFVSKLSSNLTTLSASTFLGGSSTDGAQDIALDTSGNVYVMGGTSGSGFPSTSGAYDETHNGSFDTYIAKFTNDLTTLSASTFFGTSSNENADKMILGSSGEVYVLDGTTVTSLPTTSGAYDTTHNGSSDIYVAKFTSDLTTLSAATFVGSSGSETPRDIALDTSNNVYIIGDTATTTFPTTTGAYDTTHNTGGTGNDVIILKLSSDLTTLSESTFFGGSADTEEEEGDLGYGIAVDSSGNIYVTGTTANVVTDLPTTTGAYDTTHNGSTDGEQDAFVAKFDSLLAPVATTTTRSSGGDTTAPTIGKSATGKQVVENGFSYQSNLGGFTELDADLGLTHMDSLPVAVGGIPDAPPGEIRDDTREKLEQDGLGEVAKTFDTLSDVIDEIGDFINQPPPDEQPNVPVEQRDLPGMLDTLKENLDQSRIDPESHSNPEQATQINNLLDKIAQKIAEIENSIN